MRGGGGLILCGKTDVGEKRNTNQDTFAVRMIIPQVSLGVVCDGMGGANGGNIASTIARDVFVGQIESFFIRVQARRALGYVTEGDCSALLAHAVVAANRAVYDMAQQRPELKGMGSTLVAALAVGGQVHVVNVGDSRMYLMSQGELSQVTRDHSLVQHLLDTGKITGEEAKNYPKKNMITRAVGIEKGIEADILSVDLSDCEEAVILLCSDGLSNFISDEGIHTLLQAHFRVEMRDTFTAEKTVQTLIDTANANGGGDNVTAVLMAYQAERNEHAHGSNTTI